MERRRNRGQGVSRGRGARQAQEPREEREVAAKQQHEPWAETGDQVATGIQRMTDILTCLVEQQGRAPVNQPRELEGGEDRALERFQKFSPTKFLVGSNLEAAESWIE